MHYSVSTLACSRVVGKLSKTHAVPSGRDLNIDGIRWYRSLLENVFVPEFLRDDIHYGGIVHGFSSDHCTVGLVAQSSEDRELERRTLL